MQTGVSVERLEQLEDEIAGILTAREHLEDFRTLVNLLHRKDYITRALYHDYMSKLDKIASALQDGKRNTALLRNGAKP